jgi:magnesium-protoporphyrin O-methyltransferase
MNCCQCQGIETIFNKKTAAKELKRYRKKGSTGTTRMLIEALKSEGVEERTLLDIGGGIGAIQHELLKAGAKAVVNVDASKAYIEAAKEEAERQGHIDRVSYHHGNFVDLALNLAPSDIVTLDRVICCYPDMEALVGLSLERAGKIYGVVYHHDAWWVKATIRIENFILWAMRSSFRLFAHPAKEVEAILYGNGFNKRRFYRRTAIWQVAVYAR